jgi:vacuolar protein sorting-associated protein VTA1
MDKLEQYKAQHSDEPAVTDDMVGKAYVEQFGLETFERADNAVKADKATRQTADTYQAAATFLDLLQIWGPVDPEAAAKIKYAKYHALRIAKALKAGEDPNLSNPKPETPAEDLLPALDPNDADVQALSGAPGKPRQASVVEVPDEADRIQKSLAQRSILDESLHPSRETSVPPPPRKTERQPSVVEVKDEADRLQRNLARQSSLDESLHPSRQPSLSQSPANDVSPIAAQDAAAFYSNQADTNDISPLDTPSERKPSVGGNYFPLVPSDIAPELPSAPTTIGAPPPELPSAPGNLASSPPSLPHAPPVDTDFASGRASLNSLNQAGRPSPPLPAHRHGNFLPQTAPGQPPQIPPNFQPQVPPPQLPQNPPQLRQTHGPVPPIPQPQPVLSPNPVHPPVHLPPASQPVNVVLDEEAIMTAQKHARWAISALNFEDVPTAIKELRGALTSLGAAP